MALAGLTSRLRGTQIPYAPEGQEPYNGPGPVMLPEGQLPKYGPLGSDTDDIQVPGHIGAGNQDPTDDIIGAKSGETPRERTMLRGPAGTQATPRQPRTPTPVSMQEQQPGVLPFEPMGDASAESMVFGGGGDVRRKSPFFGGAGGLTGGGFGSPFDPTPNEASDPITLLMQLLGGGQ